MKIVKYVFSLCLVALIVYSCGEDDNTDFVDTVSAPTNLSALVNITQDNTGLVKITPLGEGVTSFDLNYGDGSNLEEAISPGNYVEHTYVEGTYEATLTAKGLNGAQASLTQQIIVSFQAPQNLVVTIENDPGISKQVNVTATADFAMTNEINFGDGSAVVSGNIGETVSHIYTDPGTYTITVEAMGGAIATTSYTEEFEVTAIVQPLASAPTPPARADTDVISIFSSAYTDLPATNYFPDWGQGSQGSSWAMFDLGGDEMLQYVNLSYQGIALADGTSVDVSGMEFLHLDVWTADVVTDIETSLINGPAAATEAPVTRPLTADSWTSIEIPIAEYVNQGLTVNEIFQLKFVGTPWAAGTVFIDNIYFYKEPSAAPSIAGVWKVAPEAGSLAVGPSLGSGAWFSIDAAGVAARACFYDDEYVFNNDGTFNNVLGVDTWIEPWQGGTDSCGAPIAPHDGSAAATYSYNETAGTITLNGIGAYLGIPKANNAGELSDPANAPSSIIYDVTLVDINTMIINIEAGSGVFWSYKLIRDGAAPVSPLAGSWSVAPEAGSLAVGPTPGSGDWFSIDDAGVTARACFYDDEYVFDNSGSFSNVLGVDTWIEPWQGGADACGAPIAPHDGSVAATFTYDDTAGTITLNGTGAYLGIPKANNAGELSDPANAPSSITYDVTFIDANTISLSIEAGAGVFWTFKLIKN